MRFSRDRRGQSVVVGTVILFGFLILALSLYQVQIVPQENADVEFEHSQQVGGEFLDIRNAVQSASRTGDSRSTSLKLGTRYPQRTFALNPPPASGQLSTSEPRALRIENVTVNDGGNVGAYWANRTNETAAGDTITFETRSLRYSPGYNEFENGPDLVYEHSLVVAEFDSGALGRSGQTAVDSDRNRIQLTALNGTVAESGIQRTSLDPEALSAIQRSVRLNSTGGNPIVVELPTDVSMERADSLEQQWRDRLGEDAESVSVAGGTVRIELNGTESYRLELGKVGLGTGATGTDESDGYITKVSSVDGVAVAEVRDRFNNPVAGADVTVDNGTEQTVRADEDGQVEYTATNPPENVTFEINANRSDWEFVRFENLGTADKTGGVTEGNRTFNVTWLNEEPVTVVEGGDPVELNVSVTNRDGNRIRNSTIDYSFSPRQEGGLPSLSPESSAQNPGRDTVNFDPGSSNATDEFDVYASAGDDVERITVEIVSPSSLGGTVTDSETGSALGGASITVYEGDSTDPADEVTSTATAADGSYSVNVDPGQYTVEADEDGYVAETTLVDVAAEESVENVDFALDPEAATALYPDTATETAGTIDNFGNLQNDDGQVATFRQPNGGQAPPFDVTTTTQNVPSGTYTLELGVVDVNQQGNSAGIDVTVTDGSGTTIGQETITAADAGSTVSVQLDPTTSTQDISVQYTGDRRGDSLDLDFQRLVE